jgi:hypothetical protein
MAEKRHPGITMHKFTVGAGFEGLLFTIGCSLIFVIGLPALWSFVAFGAALGIGVAIFLHLTSNSRSERMKPLSILSAEQKVESLIPQEDRRQNLMRATPGSARPRLNPASESTTATYPCAAATFGGFPSPV